MDIGQNSKSKKVLLYLKSTLLKYKNEKKDTGKNRINVKDQFYTNENVSKTCVDKIIEILPDTKQSLWVEPSAGKGSFIHNLPSYIERVALDIEPKSAHIDKQDYLTWMPPTGKDIIVFGNPPFGRQSSLAKLFISKSCEFAKVIAFILPKSFTKPSMSRAFDLKFHLIYSKEVEKYSFEINDNKHDVPWKKKEINRKVENKVNPEGFKYVKDDNDYDIAIRRVGGLAGKCYKRDEKSFSVQSYNFIKFNEENVEYIDTIIEKINEHVFPSNTVGPRSLSKTELNAVINEIISLYH